MKSITKVLFVVNFAQSKNLIEFQRLKRTENQIIFDIPELKNTNIRKMYQKEASKRLPSLEETDDIELNWSYFKDAAHTTADSITGRQ